MQQPPKDTPGKDPVSHAKLNQTHEEILEYWTEERMADARPRELRLSKVVPRPKQRDPDAGEPESPDQD